MANVTIQNATYSLLEYYHSMEENRGNGILFDLKYIQLLLKGIFGVAGMVEMDEIDLNDPKVQLAQGNNFFFCMNVSLLLLLI